MFGKLLTLEWKATWKMQLLLAAGFSILYLLCLGSCLLIRHHGGENSHMAVNLLVGTISVLAVLYCALVLIQLLIHHYRSRFTDRGYLTFTLPAKPRDSFFAALLNNLLWTVLSILLLMLSAIILILCSAKAGMADDTMFYFLPHMLFLLPLLCFQYYPYLFVPPLLLFWLYSVCVPLSVITFACARSPRRRFGRAIGIYAIITAILVFGVLSTFSACILCDWETSAGSVLIFSLDFYLTGLAVGSCLLALSRLNRVDLY